MSQDSVASRSASHGRFVNGRFVNSRRQNETVMRQAIETKLIRDSRPQIAIQHPIVDGFADVVGADLF
jgi:hypothetical protein